MQSDRLELFKTILGVQSKSRKSEKMEDFILDFADALPFDVDLTMDDGNIYITKGRASTYPTFVAHTDTVHNIVADDEFQVVQTGDLLYGLNPIKKKMQGIGGDDKVGIFLALTLLEELDVVKVAFFRDEEVGCVGSAFADMDFFTKSAFVLEADRKGNDDFVRDISGVKLYGDNFAKAISPYLKLYGYKEYDFGGLTDVMLLKEMGLRVACANVSCGYYNPHMDGEIISIADVENTLNLFRDLAENLGYRKWKHTYQAPARRVQRYTGFNSTYYSTQKGTGGVQSFAEWKSSIKPATQQAAKSAAISVDSLLKADRELLEAAKDERAQAVNDYLNAGVWDDDDDETDIRDRSPMAQYGGRNPEYCPTCEQFGILDYDIEVGEWFCMICQDYVMDAELRVNALNALNDTNGVRSVATAVRVG